jgi:membrane-associated phospholipid phosphatase
LFATSVLAAYFFCYLVFVIIPVRGPFHVFGALPFNDGPHLCAQLAHRLLDRASSAGTAFPSSHVAAAACVWLISRRYLRRLSWVVLLLAVGIFFGTVYGGFHYAIDAIGGAAVGVAFGLLGPRLHRALTRGIARGASVRQEARVD